ncbi:hypothetical protein VPHD148_0169 [Vibrio phage D148]
MTTRTKYPIRYLLAVRLSCMMGKTLRGLFENL